jgi:hypothetical protein
MRPDQMPVQDDSDHRTSRRYAVEQDARQMEIMADHLRVMADVEWDKLRDWQRYDLERRFRSQIKHCIEILIHNMPS